jgi:hypothetical protein
MKTARRSIEMVSHGTGPLENHNLRLVHYENILLNNPLSEMHAWERKVVIKIQDGQE